MTAQRGRPRSFDDQDTLEKVLDVFWKQGFIGTSLTDLCSATGLNKPSLYGAFGNKEALFLAALDRYTSHFGTPAIAALQAEPDAFTAIRSFMLVTVDKLTAKKMPAGCFIITNAAATGSTDMPEAVAAALAKASQNARIALDARLKRAVAEGQLPPDADPKSLADFIEITLAGAAALAQGGAPRDALIKAVDIALNAWPKA
ncbi:MAG: transcriptional regulator, TetR family [Cypionkella sp.]|uniref:TetR/AcrR family transcriptional regulator n=1 Tax=Cypionkella sp. TaxID=2811411 RepID=UPI002617D163|nr:TetR/AcrR family transcriptional regulator [Cypionkella sp.]MDB5661292.1 transcriptional regulator, TetR family [Cypionkella sp.]